jgi:hypothetical protein
MTNRRNVVVTLFVLFLAFFLPFSLSIIIHEEQLRTQPPVAKLPPFSFTETFPLTGSGNEIAIARTGDVLSRSAPPTLVAAQKTLEDTYPASFLSANATNNTKKKLVAADTPDEPS